MTDLPPAASDDSGRPEPAIPPLPSAPSAAGGVGPWGRPYGVQGSPEQVRVAWQRRNDSDYMFDFWTALGWILLTLGFYSFYILYQLVRRSREHNLRRIELLDAATTFAWERATARGLGEELRPHFERIAARMSVLRMQTTEFRDPAVWVLIALFGSTIADIVAYVLLDGDLVKHDYAEGAIEAELSAIYEQLGFPVAPPDPARLKGKHRYGQRIAALIGTCGLYGLWWLRDVMVEGNRHFEENWRWEDDLAIAVQGLASSTSP